MRHPSFAFLPVLALSLAACGDVQEPIAPRARATSDAARTSVTAPLTVIYSNFGAGMTFNPVNGWFIYGKETDTPFQQAISEQFHTSPGEYSFAQVSLPLSHGSSGRSLRVLLQADSLGLPGHVIEEMALDYTGPYSRRVHGDLSDRTRSPRLPLLDHVGTGDGRLGG